MTPGGIGPASAVFSSRLLFRRDFLQPQVAKQLALDLMGQHGLITHGWNFVWFENDAKTLGVCSWDRTDRQIRLNLDYVDGNSDEHVKDTILHEIAHALTPEELSHHGPVWRKKCKEIGAIPRAFCYDSQSFAPPYFEEFPLERFSSGESNLDNLLDGSKHGRCRWCGTKMPRDYPKDGHALVYRCCSAICQLLYAYAILGYFILPTVSGKVDFETGGRSY
jgi:hypothetical protein